MYLCTERRKAAVYTLQAKKIGEFQLLEIFLKLDCQKPIAAFYTSDDAGGET